MNLILGPDSEERTRTSPKARSCTLDARQYNVTIENKDFRIYETVGLIEPQTLQGPNILRAIQKEYRLLPNLADAGGVNLLILCVQKYRTTAGMQHKYNFLRDIRFPKKLPVVLVVMHPEHEEDIEDWWTNNQVEFANYGIHPVGHACITTNSAFAELYAASRRRMHSLLVTHGFDTDFGTEKLTWIPKVSRMWQLAGIQSRFDSFTRETRTLREAGFGEEDILCALKKMAVRNADPSHPKKGRH